MQKEEYYSLKRIINLTDKASSEELPSIYESLSDEQKEKLKDFMSVVIYLDMNNYCNKDKLLEFLCKKSSENKAWDKVKIIL